MRAEITLTEWKPAEATLVVGVSPELQRQWRRLGLLNQIEGKQKRATFTLFGLSAMAAARSLIDLGSGVKEIAEPHGALSIQLSSAVMLRGKLRSVAGLSLDDVTRIVHSRTMITTSEYSSRRYFAFRNDVASIGSRKRFLDFDDFGDLTYWLEHGDERLETAEEIYDGNRNIDTGRQLEPLPPMTPEEEAEQAAFEAEYPRESALPRGDAAVVIDVHSLADRLLTEMGRPWASIWSPDLIGTAHSSFQIIAAMSRLYKENLDLMKSMISASDALTDEFDDLSDAEIGLRMNDYKKKNSDLDADFAVKDQRIAEVKRHLADLEEQYRLSKDRESRFLADIGDKPANYYHGYQFGWRYLESGGSREPVDPVDRV